MKINRLSQLFSDLTGVLGKKTPLSDDSLLFICGVSRSGTTLLATILDSHSQITLGYELIPRPLPDPPKLLKQLDEGLALAKGNFSKCGSKLRQKGYTDAGQWLSRCHRAGATESDVREILDNAGSLGLHRIYTLVERLKLAHLIARKVSLKNGTALYGFKYTNSLYGLGHNLFPKGYFMSIVRDPRDVAASQKERGFGRSVKEICNDWNRHNDAFMKFNKQNGGLSKIVRYEDLVTQPQRVITELFEDLPVHPEPGVFKFYESKATIHDSRHPNVKNLKKDFFTHSIGRWKNQLSKGDVSTVEKICRKNMELFRYETNA